MSKLRYLRVKGLSSNCHQWSSGDWLCFLNTGLKCHLKYLRLYETSGHDTDSWKTYACLHWHLESRSDLQGHLNVIRHFCAHKAESHTKSFYLREVGEVKIHRKNKVGNLFSRIQLTKKVGVNCWMSDGEVSYLICSCCSRRTHVPCRSFVISASHV